MKYSTVGKNNMLNGLGGTHTSLHTGIPNQSGSNEVAGGTPAYARQATSFGAAAAGSVNLTSQPIFDVPAGDTIYFIGIWDDVAAGSFLGCLPINGGAVTGAGTGATSDTITSYAHGLSDDDQVTLEAVAGSALPTGLNATTVYFVVNSTADTFELSLTLGGAAVNITAASQLVFTKVIPQAYASQGTLTVNSGEYNLLG